MDDRPQTDGGSLARELPRPGPESDQRRPGVAGLTTGLGRGLQAGLVATVVMTAFRLPIVRSLPPTANFWATYVGDGEPADYPGIGLVLHLLYGTGAGAAFGVLFPLLDSERVIEAEQRGLLWGSVYAMVLSAVGSRVVLAEVLDVRLEADELTLFHAGHLVYGLALGAWVGSRTEGVGDPETEYDYEDEA